jgi:two-component SAPR family response regulator
MESFIGIRTLRKERQHEAVGTAIGVAQQAIALYRGDFLAGDADRPWAASRRERLRRRLLRLVAMVGRAYEEQGAWDKAADCYLRGLDASELAEELYQCLIHCYHRLGRHGEIASIYQRCHKALALRGIKPSSRTRAIYERAVHENRD